MDAGWRWRPRYGGGRWPFAVLDVLLVCLAALCVLIETRVHRVDAVSPYPNKPGWGLGQDWLLVGRGVPADRKAGAIMLLHIPHDGGRPTLVNLPVDLYAPVPGRGAGTLGRAYAQGGARLLVGAFEAATRIGVERYAELDLARFAAQVDAVRVCPPVCARLSGGEAPGPPAGRLVSALISRAADPRFFLNPLRDIRLILAGTDALTVDEDGHLNDLIRLGLCLRPGARPITVEIPTVSHGTVAGVGPTVAWKPDAAGRLIAALVTDRPLTDPPRS